MIMILRTVSSEMAGGEKACLKLIQEKVGKEISTNLSLFLFFFFFFFKYLLKDVAVKGKGNEEELKEPVR